MVKDHDNNNDIFQEVFIKVIKSKKDTYTMKEYHVLDIKNS